MGNIPHHLFDIKEIDESAFYNSFIENSNNTNTKVPDNDKDKIDVMILCGGSATDLPIQSPKFAKMFKQKSTTIDLSKCIDLGPILMVVASFANGTTIFKNVEKLKNLFDKLSDMGFKVIIYSNAMKKRIEPFKKYLLVDCQAMARKPNRGNYKKVLKYGFFSISSKYDLNFSLCCSKILFSLADHTLV